MDAADIFAGLVAPQAMPLIDNNSILMGYANLYGGYVFPVQRAAEQYGCDARELILRLGARKLVAAQEDMVIEEAQMLAAEQKKAA